MCIYMLYRETHGHLNISINTDTYIHINTFVIQDSAF